MCTDDAYGIFNNHNVGTAKTNHGGKGYTHTHTYYIRYISYTMNSESRKYYLKDKGRERKRGRKRGKGERELLSIHCRHQTHTHINSTGATYSLPELDHNINEIFSTEHFSTCYITSHSTTTIVSIYYYSYKGTLTARQIGH